MRYFVLYGVMSCQLDSLGKYYYESKKCIFLGIWMGEQGVQEWKSPKFIVWIEIFTL